MDEFYDIITIELEIVEFFYDIIVKELEMNPGGFFNKECLHQVRSAYCKFTIDAGISSVSFDNPGLRAAYMYLNASCYGSSLAYNFLKMLHINPKLLHDAMFTCRIDICCLGGGPAIEIVAIAKSLEIVLTRLYHVGRPVQVNAMVVDVDPGWESTLRKIRQIWFKHLDCNVIKLRVLTFIQADLTEPLDEEVRQAIGSADIVTMVKFVSAVYGSKSREKISNMLQEIIGCVRDYGLLFYFNSPRIACLKEVIGVISSSKSMTTVYGPNLDDIYYLKLPTRHACFDRYYKHYGADPPTLECKNHVVGFQKMPKLKEFDKTSDDAQKSRRVTL